MRPESDGSSRVLWTLYAALAASVALLAVVAGLLGPSGDPSSWGTFRIAWLVVVAGGLAAGRIVRSRFERGERTPQEGIRTAIAVWALAEGPAMLGLVSYLLTGDRAVFFLALTAFAWMMARNPPRAFRPRRVGRVPDGG